MRLIRTLSLLALLAGSYAMAKDPVNQNRKGVAIKGYDTVAYHTQGQPVKGSGDHTHAWNGATWQFASAANLEKFKANPEKYAPKYGGYCAYAVSKGATANIDPNAWKLVEGALYLNYNASIQKKWSKDIPGYIAKADANWPGVLK